MTATKHISVLPEETIDGLNLTEDAVVVDATLGGGGHSRMILERIGATGKLIALDVDPEAIRRFQEQTNGDARVQVVRKNFAQLEEALAEAGVEIGEVDAIVADLGFSSDQIESADRGLSFLLDGPLDMRLDPTEERTAGELVNTLDEQALAALLREYSDESRSHQIARAIVRARELKPIMTTRELAEVIEQSLPMRARKKSGIHPATKSFQALRIAVNKEFECLEKFLPQAFGSLRVSGHLAIISFHSGEDRIVKRFFRDIAGGCICPKDFPICRCGKVPLIRILTKKPIIASHEELQRNPRSRSAKLRVAEKIEYKKQKDYEHASDSHSF
ncbi:MAG: 16S rRNA (cytosine(1402)-N(4))-methyltransferase RsmH [Candidatus Moraniibacteriota bacterium]